MQYGQVTLQLSQPGGVSAGAGVVSTLGRAHIVLQHANGTVALDTTFDFPVGTSGVTVTLRAALLPGVPAGGETMNLTVEYLTAGVVVFRGGPIAIKVTPVAAGSPGAPAQVAVTYVGPGAGAARVRITPRSGSTTFGGTFTFAAAAQDAAGAAIPSTPVVWYSLDPSIATPTSPISGSVTARNQPGSARIVAQLLTGPADTVTLLVQQGASASARGSRAPLP